MSINQLIGPQPGIKGIGPKPSKGQGQQPQEESFMNVLRDRFSELTAQMQPVPGMPGGIYSLSVDNNIPPASNDATGQSVAFVV